MEALDTQLLKTPRTRILHSKFVPVEERCKSAEVQLLNE